jgi:hypothetical protein
MIDPVRARLPQAQQPHGFVFPRFSFFSAHTLISMCAKTFFETLLNLSSILQMNYRTAIYLFGAGAHGIRARNPRADGVFLCTRQLNGINHSVRQ